MYVITYTTCIIGCEELLVCLQKCTLRKSLLFTKVIKTELKQCRKAVFFYIYSRNQQNRTGCNNSPIRTWHKSPSLCSFGRCSKLTFKCTVVRRQQNPTITSTTHYWLTILLYVYGTWRGQFLHWQGSLKFLCALLSFQSTSCLHLPFVSLLQLIFDAVGIRADLWKRQDPPFSLFSFSVWYLRLSLFREPGTR